MRPLARLSAALVVALLAAPQAAAEPKVLGTHPLSSAPYGLSSPQFAAVDSVRHEVWVAGYYSANVVVVDGASRQPVAAIPGIQYPVAVAVDGGRSRAYVATYNSLLVFDTVSRKKLFSYPLYTPGQAYFQPFAMALDEANGHVYLYGARTVYSGQTSSSTMRLAEYDPVTGAMVAGIDLPDYHYSSKLAVSGAKIFLPVNIHDQEKMTYRSELWVIDKALPAVSQKIATTSQYTHSMTLHPGNGAVYLYDGGKLVSYAPGASGQWVKASSGPAGGFLWDMALDPVTNLIYGLDRYNDLVRIIDPKTLKETGTLPAGAEPAIVVMDSALGKSFVFNSKSNNAVVYDLATGTLAGWVDLRRCEPRGLAVDPGSWRTLAACGMTGSVAFWNKASHAVDKTVTVPYGQPSGLAIFPGLNKAYIKVNPAPYGYLERLSLSASELAPRIGNRYTVTGLAAYPEATALLLSEYFLPGGTSTTAVLTMVDAQSDLVSKSIPLGPSYHYPLAPVVNAATAKAYVVLYATHQVVAVDLGSGAVLKRIPVGNYPMAAAVNPNLNRVYVANYGSNSLSMIDGATDAVLGTVAVGPAPKAVAVKKRGARVYVANSGDGTVTVLDGKTLAKIATLPSGNLPSDIAVDETAEQALVANESDASITVIEDPAPVDGAAPAVNHTPLTGPFPEYSPVTVEAQVTDDKAVAVVTLTYWEPGAGTYYTVAMANVGGSLYRGVIPAEFLFSLSKGGKVQYFIDASDAEGNGPPTGQTPGSAGQPNEFSVLKAFSPLWTYTFGGFFGGAYRMVPGPSAAIGDIRPDIGGLEVATGNEEYWPFGFNGPSGRWFLFTSTGGVAFWKNTENDEAHSSVNLFDLDGDGALEMLGGTTSGRELQAWDRFGGWLWRFLLDGHHLSTPAVDVLKPGEAPTVFGGSFDSRFRAIHGKAGTLRWSYPVSTGTWIWSSPAVGDLDGDGAKEVVFGSDQMTAGTPNLFSLDAHTGALRWSAVLGGHVRASAAIADLDADGVLEVLIGAPDGIFRAFHGKTGQVLWSYKTGGEIISSAAVGDVDGDGKPEVLFGSGDGKLYCLDRLGALRWATPLGSPVLGSPALARRTPGPGLAVYIAANSGLLHVLAGADGKKLAGLALNAPVASSPVVGDIDGDGKLEVLFQDRRGDTLDTKTGDVFWAIRDTGSQVPVYAREWPLFRRDPAHTGVYPWQSAPPPPPPPPPDTAAPVSVITSPAGGLVFATTTVSILGTASDDDSGIAKVELGLADLATDEEVWSVANGTASFNMGLFSLQDGHSYRLRSRATDGAGNIETPVSFVDFKVELPAPPPPPPPPPPPDTAAPVSVITSPAGGLVFATTTVSILGTASDDDSGIAKVELGLADLAGTEEHWYLASGTATFSSVFSGLQDQHSYRVRSRATDGAGNVEVPFSQVDFTVNLPPKDGACTAYIKIPKEGKTLWGNAVTIMAEVSCPVTKVLFQYRYDLSSEWKDVTSADAKHPYAVYWNISDNITSTGTYHLRAVAYDEDGLADIDIPEIWVGLDDAHPDIREDGNPEVDPNQPHRKEEKVDPAVSAEVSTADGTKVVIPAGAVPAGESLQIVSLPSQNAPKPKSPYAILKPAGVYRELKFGNGTKTFSKSLTVFLPAPDEDNDGLLDGTKVPVKDLKAYYYSEEKKEWAPTSPKTHGGLAAAALWAQPGPGVSFETDHFTLFGLFQETYPTAPDSGEVYVFPNPAKSGNPPTFHVEVQARTVEIRVYSLGGALMRTRTIEGPALLVDGKYAFRHVLDPAGLPAGVYLYTVFAQRDGLPDFRAKGRFGLIR